MRRTKRGRRRRITGAHGTLAPQHLSTSLTGVVRSTHHCATVSPRYDIPKAAPKPLRLVQELVNTTDIEHRREWLPTASALAEWLGEHPLPGAGSVPAPHLPR